MECALPVRLAGFVRVAFGRSLSRASDIARRAMATKTIWSGVGSLCAFYCKVAPASASENQMKKVDLCSEIATLVGSDLAEREK
jgi:hypothetical protein